MAKSKILYNLIAGVSGGFLAWIATEPWIFKSEREIASAGVPVAQIYAEVILFGAIMGFLIGAALGAAEGVVLRASKLALVGGGIGAGVGLIGGIFGGAFAQTIFQTLLIGAKRSLNPLVFFRLIMARSIGWALFGAFVGLAEGITFRSLKKVGQGALGGALGGGIGGGFFDIASLIFGSGIMSRLLCLVATGGCVGALVGLVEEAFKQAWLVVISGRNEGKQFILSKTLNILGRDELADVGLFGDKSISKRHAAIKVEQNRYILQDMGSPTGTLVNGNPVSSQVLKDGDIIDIGSVRLLFKARGKPAMAPAAVPGAQPWAGAPSPPQPQPQVPSGVCPFCGTPIDPRTQRCACSLAPGEKPTPLTLPSQISVSPPESTLIGLEGPYAGHSFSVKSPKTTIGRETGRDIFLPDDSTVSRKHATISFENGQYLISDEGSANGTFVNGRRISREIIKSGDRITIGRTIFIFQAPAA